MIAIPRATLAITLLLLLPMVLAAALHVFDMFGRAPGTMLALYGAMMLASSGGALFGFTLAAREGDSRLLVILAMLPVIYAFAVVWIGASALDFPLTMLELLALGFFASLILENLFALRDLTPLWWFSLRWPVVTVTIICLLLGTYL